MSDHAGGGADALALLEGSEGAGGVPGPQDSRGDRRASWGGAAGRRPARLRVETVRKRVNQADIDAGERPGVTSEDNAKIRRL